MKKYRQFIIFVIVFLLVAGLDFIIFSSLFSQILVDRLSWVLNNFILSSLLFFWMFIGIPALVAYFTAFELVGGDRLRTENLPATADNSAFKSRHHPRFITILITTVILGILVTGIIRFLTQPRWLPYTFHPVESDELKGQVSPQPSMVAVSPVSNPTHVLLTIAQSPSAVSGLFKLYFSATDYAKVDPSGEVSGVRVRLYDANNEFLGEQTIPPRIYENNIGKGGNVLFEVPFGSYRAEAVTNQLSGNTTVTVKSFTDQQYYTIRMYAKDISIYGKYFLDANKSGKYDGGETVFAGKKNYGLCKNRIALQKSV